MYSIDNVGQTTTRNGLTVSLQDASVESITENMLGGQTLNAEYWGPGGKNEPGRLLPVLPYRTKNACICANETVVIVLFLSNTF